MLGQIDGSNQMLFSNVRKERLRCRQELHPAAVKHAHLRVHLVHFWVGDCLTVPVQCIAHEQGFHDVQ